MQGGMESLFFSLLRVALGTQSTLSRTPSAAEWKELYAMAQKQALLGICTVVSAKGIDDIREDGRGGGILEARRLGG